MVQGVETFRIQPGQAIGKAGLIRLLDGWERSAGSGEKMSSSSASLYLKAGEIREFLRSRHVRPWQSGLADLGNSALDSETGLACLRMGDRGLAIAPPFPLLEGSNEDGWNAAPLLELLNSEYLVGMVLLRLGRFSAAVFRGQTMLSSKTDSRYVKGRHSAGGTSQKRFERIRQGQIRRVYDKACEAVEAQFAPYADSLDYITLGGESATLNGFLKTCPFLQRREKIIQARRLNVRDPKRDALEKAGEMLWESRVWPLNFDGPDGTRIAGSW